MLNPYDLDNFFVAENCRKIKIDELVSNAMKVLKIRLIEAQISALGVDVEFTTTKTQFNGVRVWFICPNCKKRVGTLYEDPIGERVGCRTCLNLKYRKQRIKIATQKPL